MNKEVREKVVMNYYRATNALMEIGTTKNIPEELMKLCLDASSATLKIVDYVNNHKEQEVINLEEKVDNKPVCFMPNDNAYPLCTGKRNKFNEVFTTCKSCNLYEDMRENN